MCIARSGPEKTSGTRRRNISTRFATCWAASTSIPHSSEIAQRTVRATAHFTTDDDGLTKEWRGRVWLNPPYAQPDIADFVAKVITEYRACRITEAIMLTHNFTCTRWFHKALRSAQAFCLTLGRVKFVDPSGNIASPTKGSASSTSATGLRHSLRVSIASALSPGLGAMTSTRRGSGGRSELCHERQRQRFQPAACSILAAG